MSNRTRSKTGRATERNYGCNNDIGETGIDEVNVSADDRGITGQFSIRLACTVPVTLMFRYSRYRTLDLYTERYGSITGHTERCGALRNRYRTL